MDDHLAASILVVRVADVFSLGREAGLWIGARVLEDRRGFAFRRIVDRDQGSGGSRGVLPVQDAIAVPVGWDLVDCALQEGFFMTRTVGLSSVEIPDSRPRRDVEDAFARR